MGDNRSRVRQRGGRKAKPPSLLKRINRHAAGIDCGSETHFVAVPSDRESEPVRSFKTFTSDLHRLADWLSACNIKTVAMESTGVYWIPIFEILEDRGFEVVLVNSRHVKNVPGRKSDVLDCQWIQELHSVGLLRGSFRPTAEIASLRAYLRHREKLIQDAASHIQRMQKALIEMNLQLHNVISDITGVTGMRILRDIVAGVTDPAALATHRDYRCRATEDDIAASLTGNYRAEHLFSLRQNLDLFDTFQRQIQECDGEIESLLLRLAPKQSKPKRSVPPPRCKFKFCDNEPRFDIRDPLFRLSGVDLTQIDGIAPYTALRLIAEIGTDMTRWPTYKHFTSWLTLAPKNKISGARLISSRTQPSANKAAGLLRMSAMVLGRTSTALGAYYRRIAYRIGKPKAITATARKLAILVYRMLKGELDYADPGASAYDEQHRERTLRNVRSRAKRLGFGLVDLETGELLQGAVT
ncbi:MAG: IS110 family transposase [Myxococcales bacterium]|nr:IS110 family transposase [Myxococcales bacterium]